MTDEEQKKIFGKNLSKYIALSGKDQKEVAKDLGYAATTFNTWCVGKIIPSMGKIQKIADYFGIGKSDLLDDKDNKYSPETAKMNAQINKNEQLQRIMAYAIKLSDSQKDAIEHILKEMSESKKEEE